MSPMKYIDNIDGKLDKRFPFPKKHFKHLRIIEDRVFSRVKSKPIIRSRILSANYIDKRACVSVAYQNTQLYRYLAGRAEELPLEMTVISILKLYGPEFNVLYYPPHHDIRICKDHIHEEGFFYASRDQQLHS